MAADLASMAKEAFIDDDFERAVDLLSQALDVHPCDAQLLSDRAQAHIKLRNFTEAVADASRAIQLDPQRAKAYLRKGIACMELEEYHTAKAALEMGASISQDHSRFNKLIQECELKCADDSSYAAKANITAIPSTSDGLNEENAGQVETSSVKTEAVAPKEPKYNECTAQFQIIWFPIASCHIRHSYYQSAREVVVTIYAKGVPKENVLVNYGEQILHVTVDIPNEEAYHLQTRLFAKILPANCKYTVRSTTIEIRLAKAEEIHWMCLEYSNTIVAPKKANAWTGESSDRPTYPSSKPKKTDWDKVEAEVKKEEKEEKLDGDAGLHKFFRDIYGSADEDMRRAMNKSFAESNGTVLSTNWKDVGKKKVECSAPDGMELKKWEY